MALLDHYEWPGNIRELENAIERAMVVAAGTGNSAKRILPFACPPMAHRRAPWKTSSARTSSRFWRIATATRRWRRRCWTSIALRCTTSSRNTVGRELLRKHRESHSAIAAGYHCPRETLIDLSAGLRKRIRCSLRNSSRRNPNQLSRLTSRGSNTRPRKYLASVMKRGTSKQRTPSRASPPSICTFRS